MGARIVPVTLLLLAALLTPVGPAEARGRYAVTAHLSLVRGDVGQVLTVSGRVRPKAPHKRVRVQELAPGTTTWRTVARARLTKKSRYAATIRIGHAGPTSYRVVKPRARGHRAGTSAPASLTGWQWRPMSSLPPNGAPSSSVTAVPSAASHDLVFGPSLVFDGSGSARYRIDGRCDAFDAHVWLTPDSGGGIAEQRQAILGGHNTGDTANSGDTARATQWIERGSDPVHVYRGPSLIALLDTISLSAGGLAGETTIWGGPRMHCRF